MNTLDSIRAENKAVRRNALKQLLKSIEGNEIQTEEERQQILSVLPYSDEYDTCRELSFKNVVMTALIDCRQPFSFPSSLPLHSMLLLLLCFPW